MRVDAAMVDLYGDEHIAKVTGSEIF